MKYGDHSNQIAKMALALSIMIGTFSVFSITFGLKKNELANFYTERKDQQIYQNQNQSFSLNIGDFFSFKKTPPTVDQAAPEKRYILQQLSQLGKINAASFVAGDLDTGEIIFERKADTIYPIASVTKYMTAYTAAETLEPNEVATITAEKLRVEGNRGRFRVGDTMTIRELLYPLLLVSSNDAAEIISRQRDRSDFIHAMNTAAGDLGLINTEFEDPTGLSQNNVSTAHDLFMMMQKTRDVYPQIIDISRLSYKEDDGYAWANINKASSFPEFRGGKTGYTNAARQTSIGYYQIKLANDEIKNIGVVILQSGTRQQDTRNILDYIKRYVAYL